MMDSMMICGEVDERLPDFLEETLDEATRRRVQTHVASCVRCSALVADLDAIRTEASQLPALVPSRDLWAGISDRIATPVIALGSQPAWTGRRTPKWMIGAMAAGLVVATAGITHVITRQSLEREFAADASAELPAVVEVAAKRDSASLETEDTSKREAPASPPQRLVSVESAPAPTRADAQPAPQPATTQMVARTASEVAFDREITRLRDVLQQRRAQLDPETIIVIEQSLRVIDEAITQSREALARDPASPFLRHRLDNSLEKKVDLLRTAALLPART